VEFFVELALLIISLVLDVPLKIKIKKEQVNGHAK